jgi:co-chaperonin GroES (HSP10)
MRPLFARVLLHRPKPEHLGKGSIVPEAYRHRHAKPEGILVAAGDTCSPHVKELVGAVVMIGKMSGGDWIKDSDGTEWWICDEEDLLGVVEEPPTEAPALSAVA